MTHTGRPNVINTCDKTIFLTQKYFIIVMAGLEIGRVPGRTSSVSMSLSYWSLEECPSLTIIGKDI